jgi:Trk K+ transport system NAD-binding subunit
MTRRFDAIIIGTGQVRPFLASRLAASGMKVAIVERRNAEKCLKKLDARKGFRTISRVGGENPEPNPL